MPFYRDRALKRLQSVQERFFGVGKSRAESGKAYYATADGKRFAIVAIPLVRQAGELEDMPHQARDWQFAARYLKDNGVVSPRPGDVIEFEGRRWRVGDADGGACWQECLLGGMVRVHARLVE